MPELTPKLGIKKPLGNETVSRASFNENYDIIDKYAVREPFLLESAVYDSVGNKIEITIGPGRANFLGTLVVKDTNTYSIAAPAANTNYYLYLKSDGTVTHNTTGGEMAGAVLIWKVSTGATVDAITTQDLRGGLPGAAARVVKDHLDAHVAAADPHPQYVLDAEKGAANGVATLDANGTIPMAQVPILTTDKADGGFLRAKDLLAQGFVVSGLVASKNATVANQLDVTAGTAVLKQANGAYITRDIAASSFTTSVASIYYLDLNPDGTYSWGTAPSTQANYLPIAEVTTDASGNISTVTDKRLWRYPWSLGPSFYYRVRVGWDVTTSSTTPVNINKGGWGDTVPTVPPNWKVLYNFHIAALTAGYTATIEIYDAITSTVKKSATYSAAGIYSIDVTDLVGCHIVGRVYVNNTAASVTIPIATVIIKEQTIDN